MELLAYRPQNTPLLPNLKALNWNDGAIRYFPFISLFLSPTVTTMVVDIRYVSNAAKLWSLLRLKALALDSLFIEWGPEDEPFDESERTQEEFAGALQSLQDLTDLTLDDTANFMIVSIDNLITISQYPHLSHLTISLDEDHTGALDSRATTGSFFSALRRLSVHCDDIPMITRIIQTITSPNLKSISLISSEAYGSCTEVSSLLRAIARHKRLTSLRVSIKGSDEEDIQGSPDFIITGKTLEPSFELKELTDYRINVFALSLTKEWLKKMAQSWPKLTNLELASRDIRLRKTLQARDLKIFDQYCPQMKNISVPVRAG